VYSYTQDARKERSARKEGQSRVLDELFGKLAKGEKRALKNKRNAKAKARGLRRHTPVDHVQSRAASARSVLGGM